MNFALFGRFFLEFAMMYPAEYLCLASLQEHLRAPRKTYAIGASAITLMGLAGAAVCCMLDIETNFLLIPLLIISFWLLRWRGGGWGGPPRLYCPVSSFLLHR